ncbi:major facilitator superfamily-domain-containing protein [Mycena rebaudengoi]|nr:major facilitator superfamily-domain-containing protein [Mycena rebaudengoi]
MYDKAYIPILCGQILKGLQTFLTGALTIGLPTIGRDLNFTELHQTDLQWPITVFSLSYGCTLLLLGRIGDILGGRLMFLIGSAWFSAWSIGAALAPNAAAFIVFSALMGLGAAANTPSAIGILVARFSHGPRLNNALGVLGAGQPIGHIIGLVLGGLLTQSHIGWRGMFYVQAAMGSFFVILGFLVLDSGTSSNVRRYEKGLDWGGAFLSTAGIGLLTYSLAASASAEHGWATPRIIGLICTSVVLLVVFWFYERWREQKEVSVLMPPSIWSQPQMVGLLTVVFFAWWSFNTLLYFSTLYYQQVNLLSPLPTSVRFLPSIISGIITSLAGGWLMNRVPGQLLILIASASSVAAGVLFALLDVHESYWKATFWISLAFGDNSKSLSGGIFTVVTRMATSIGIAVTSSIATATSHKYHSGHPDLASDSPEVLMAGFRVAGWVTCAAAGTSFVVALVGLRGIGIVGKKAKAEMRETKALEEDSTKASDDSKASGPSNSEETDAASKKPPVDSTQLTAIGHD